jgi:hypothetical protein
MSATAPPLARPEVSSEAGSPVVEEDGRCDVCPHPVVDHDPIGLRFCRATRSAGSERGCVCR